VVRENIRDMTEGVESQSCSLHLINGRVMEYDHLDVLPRSNCVKQQEILTVLEKYMREKDDIIERERAIIQEKDHIIQEKDAIIQEQDNIINEFIRLAHDPIHSYDVCHRGM
jgi:hypothetical protein